MDESTPLETRRVPGPSPVVARAATSPRSGRRGLRIVRGLLTLAYPALVYAGLAYLSPRQLAIALAVVFALRAATRWRRATAAELGRLAPPAVLIGAVAVATALWDEPRFLLLVPAITNAALLLAFAHTLAGGREPLIETFARLQVGDLPVDEVAYCRGVTQVWCGFFLVNCGVSLWLALRGDVGAWALYTGVIAYLLVGLVFGTEFVVRAWRFGRYGGTLVEPLFRRWFPKAPSP